MALELYQFEIILNLGFYAAFRGSPEPQGKSHVFKHRKVGKEGVVLKHRVDLPPVRGEREHIGSIYGHFAAVGAFKTRKNPQQGSFTAPGRPQEGEEFSLLYGKMDVMQDPKIAEGFGNPLDDYIAPFQSFSFCLLRDSSLKFIIPFNEQ
jgi:hypothetical protein